MLVVASKLRSRRLDCHHQIKHLNRDDQHHRKHKRHILPHYLECSCHMTNQGYQHRWACAIESCASLHEARTVDAYWSLRCLTLLRVQQVWLVALVSSLAWRSKRRCRENVEMGLHQGSHRCYRTLIRHWTNHESHLVSDTTTQDSALTPQL
jgi:hypothetical protein